MGDLFNTFNLVQLLLLENSYQQCIVDNVDNLYYILNYEFKVMIIDLNKLKPPIS